MATVDDLYTLITGSSLSNSDNDPNISNYLLDLLSKDYLSISQTSAKLLEDDRKFREKLHNFVIDSAPIALNNINFCTTTSEQVCNLSKTASDISKATTSCNLKAMECAETLSSVVCELKEVSSGYSDYKFVNSLVTYLNEFEMDHDEDKLSKLLVLNEVLKNIPESQNTKLGQFFTEKVRNILYQRESELFDSFNDDTVATANTISLIKKIGFSNDEDISVGFLKNRLKHIKQSFDSCVSLSKTDPHSALEQSVNTLKKLHTVSTCYKSVFGDVDVRLSTFMNRVFQEFFNCASNILKDPSNRQFDKTKLQQLDDELAKLSALLAPFGLSFQVLTKFTLSSFVAEGQ